MSTTQRTADTGVLEVVLTSDRFEHDPIGRELVEFLHTSDLTSTLGNAVIYYDFPSYADYETVTHTPSVLVLSPTCGITAIRAVSALELASGNVGGEAGLEESLLQFSSILIGRLLKSKQLRRSVSTLKVRVEPVVYAPNFQEPKALELPWLTSLEAIAAYFADRPENELLTENDLLEARSVIEGAKALVRPSKRLVQNPQTQLAAVALSKLESDIANFDQKQRRAALTTIPGPQRIRGLAGSGKTVILAMKVAHLHLKYPDAGILVTFFTRSLRETIRQLVTRFYRHYKDSDPDWDLVHIRHGWGGSKVPGVYADAARRSGSFPLTLRDAKALARPSEEPFEFACRSLVETGKVLPFYDFLLIDEGQDFPSSFYQLAYQLTKGDRDRKSIIWAYDELQNILDVNIRSPEELFGKDEHGVPLVSLERSAADLPRGAENDLVLSKCYRNQRETLLAAHALGFGIYSQIVQLLESKEHWEDVGYEVVQGDLDRVGDHIVIHRPAHNSPLAIDDIPGFPLIQTWFAPDFASECAWAADQVRNFIDGGLSPHDVVIIALDDRAAREYFKTISAALAASHLETHNLLADPYSDPPFFIEGRVTLATIYKAKGNEAPAIVAVGLDGAGRRTRLGRNKVFTAFTRSKAWLRVSGMGPVARGLLDELDVARQKFPNLEFEMPDLAKIELIQRDLGKKQAEVKRLRDEYLRKLREHGLSEDEARDLLEEEIRGAS